VRRLPERDVRGVFLFSPLLDLSADAAIKSIAVPGDGDESISPLHMAPAFPPILIMQGETDMITPLGIAQQFAAHTGAELIVIAKAWHGFVVNPVHIDRITKTMLRFIGAQIAPHLTSQCEPAAISAQ
jgi:acetyl esterase/lipase